MKFFILVKPWSHLKIAHCMRYLTCFWGLSIAGIGPACTPSRGNIKVCNMFISEVRMSRLILTQNFMLPTTERHWDRETERWQRQQQQQHYSCVGVGAVLCADCNHNWFSQDKAIRISVANENQRSWKCVNTCGVEYYYHENTTQRCCIMCLFFCCGSNS